MDLNQAERAIQRAWLLSAIAIPAYVVAILLGMLFQVSLHLYAPWLFAGMFALPELALVVVLTVLLRRKNRTAAVLLLAVFVLDRAFTALWLYVFDTAFIITWLFVTLVWGFLFLQGIRGTFAYHRLRGSAFSEP
ncbi:MAG: hypothetical protein JXA97_12125 [Anaerolineales bacterium]|nr:hypothetical protein [Anaerolineales bacterium]